MLIIINCLNSLPHSHIFRGMLRGILVLLALVTLSSALECYTCGQVHNKPTNLQMGHFNKVIEKLHMRKCREDTVQVCKPGEDECQMVHLESTLGDETAAPVTATVYKCGQIAKREKLCRTMKLSAHLMWHLTLGYCEVEACHEDICFKP